MSNILIVSSKQSEIVGLSIAAVLGLVEGVNTKICYHEDALATFLTGDFSHVVVLNYSETKKNTGGFASWRDLCASSTGQTMVRLGFEKCEYTDYLRLPFVLPELYQELELV